MIFSVVIEASELNIAYYLPWQKLINSSCRDLLNENTSGLQEFSPQLWTQNDSISSKIFLH